MSKKNLKVIEATPKKIHQEKLPDQAKGKLTEAQLEVLACAGIVFQ